MKKSPIEMIGTLTFLMMHSDHHKEMTIEAIRDLCVPAIDAGLAVTAHAKPEEGKVPAPLAYALFGKVSDEWDEKLRDTDFALTDLPRAAWTSGTHQWLLDFLPLRGDGPSFAMKGAEALFDKGSVLNIRLRGPQNQIVIHDRTI